MIPVGTWALVRHALRRDRLLLPWWVLGVVVLYWSQAVSLESLYPTQADFDEAAASMSSNAAFVAMAGPARALDSIGGQVAWQCTAFGAVVVAFMSAVTIARHTRGDEESGRGELLHAGAVGRSAPLVAAVVVSVLANAVTGALVSASLVAEGLAAPDSWALGVGLAATGLFFTAVAAVAAQLTDGTRPLYGLVGVVAAVAFVLRAAGDLAGNGLSWVSPIGWYQAMHAFSGLRWWPLVVPLVAALALGVVTAVLFARRDLGRGLWAARPGPARGRLGLGSLAMRLQRGSVVGWVLGLFAFGFAYGSIGDSVDDLLGSSGTTEELFTVSGGDLVDGFFAVSLLMLALMACGFAISSALRPVSEESDGRAELLLASAPGRLRWFTGHLLVTVVGLGLCLLAGGLGVGAGYATVTGDGGAVLRYVGPTLGYLPAALVLVAVVVLLTGWLPRAARLGWALLVLCVVVMFFGPLLDLPAVIVDVSPFSHVAPAPVEPVAWTPLGVLTVVAFATAGVGLGGLRRRDLV